MMRGVRVSTQRMRSALNVVPTTGFIKQGVRTANSAPIVIIAVGCLGSGQNNTRRDYVKQDNGAGEKVILRFPLWGWLFVTGVPKEALDDKVKVEKILLTLKEQEDTENAR